MIQSFKEKYDYKTYHVNKVNDMRYYCISADINVPSVTSILRKTTSLSQNLIHQKFNTDYMILGDPHENIKIIHYLGPRNGKDI